MSKFDWPPVRLALPPWRSWRQKAMDKLSSWWLVSRHAMGFEIGMHRLAEKWIGTICSISVGIGIGAGVSLAGSDPTPAMYWFTGAAIAAVIAVFLFDDIKELRRWQRIMAVLVVGIVAAISVQQADGWVATKAEAIARANQRQIAIEGEAEVKRIRSEYDKRSVAAANPLKFVTLVLGANYAPGTVISGIRWRSFFTELDFMVVNPTDNNYNDIDIVVRPDFPVAQVKQVSGLPNVTFEDFFGVNAQSAIQDLATKEITLMAPLATDAGYRIHCSLIPPRQSLRLMFLLIDFKKESIVAKPGQVIPIQGEITPDSFQGVYTVTAKDGTIGNYWFGRDYAFYNPRPDPRKISVSGNYTVEGIRLNVKEDVSIPKPLSSPSPSISPSLHADATPNPRGKRPPVMQSSPSPSSHPYADRYLDMATKQLRDAVLEFVPRLRILAANLEAEVSDTSMKQMNEMRELSRTWDFKKPQTEFDKAQDNLRTQQAIKMRQVMEHYMTEYDHHFKTDSILMRDALLLRLEPGSRDEKAFFYYDNVNTSHAVKIIADDLERMAKLLK